MGAVVIFDVIANRPAAAAFNGRFFFVATDEGPTTYVSDGSTWTTVGAGGGGGSGTVEEITSTDTSVGVTAGTGPVTDLAVQDSPAVGGIAVTGTPSVGDVLTATSATDADWEPPSGASLDQQGIGSPVGLVTPTGIGYRYTDTDTGGLYEAVGVTDADWVAVSGPADDTVPGVSTSPAGRVLVLGKVGDQVYIGDTAAWAGTGNGISLDGNGSDGAQQLSFRFGPAGEFVWTFGADGSLQGSESGNPFFRVAPDGDIHVLAGASVVADL